MQNNTISDLEIDRIEETLVNLENLQNNFQLKIDEFSLIQYDHFNNLRREIDIKRESLIENLFKKTIVRGNENLSLDKINKSSSQLIKKFEHIEEEFRKNFSQIKQTLIIPIDFGKQRANLKRREPLEHAKSYYENLLHDLEIKCENFKLFEYDLMRNRFVIDSEQSSLIGVLYLHFDFIKTINVDILNIMTCSFDRNDLYLINLNTNSILKKYSGHVQGVECFVIDNDQTKLISGSADSTIKVFDLKTGELLNSLIGHTRKIWSLKLLKNDRLLASASLDKTIIIWNLQTFKSILTLKKHRESVFCIDYLTTTNQLISGSDDRTICMWDLKGGICLRILQGHSDTIRCFKTDLANDFFASGSSDKTIRIWTSVGKFVRVLKGHLDWICCLEFSNGHLFSCGCDRTIREWNLINGICIRVLTGHLDYVYCIKLNPKNNAQLISGSMDRCVKIWDLGEEKNQGKCVQTYHMDSCVWRLDVCSIF